MALIYKIHCTFVKELLSMNCTKLSLLLIAFSAFVSIAQDFNPLMRPSGTCIKAKYNKG